MHRTLTFPGKLKSSQHVRLDQFLCQLTELYNGARAERIWAYEKTGSSPSKRDQQKSLTVIRRDEVIGPKFSAYRCDAQRSVLDRLDNAFQAYFRRCKENEKSGIKKNPGFPRHKSTGRGIRSFEVTGGMLKIKKLKGIRADGTAEYGIDIKGIGVIKFRARPAHLAGKHDTVRIVKTARRVWVQIVVELDNVPAFRPFSPVGIDVGVKEQIATSTGETVSGIKRNAKKIKKMQRAVSRAQKGSKSRAKKVCLLAKAHERVAISERNACHRLTTWLVSKYTHLALEEIDRESMIKTSSRVLTRRIHEQLWGSIANQLTYKAESAGGEIRRVNPAYTSRACSECGWRRPTKLPLSVRKFRCKNTECNSVMDRDVNAARNILKRAKFEPPSWHERDSLAGWEVGLPSSHPGASENVERGVESSDALKRQDAEQCAAGARDFRVFVHIKPAQSAAQGLASRCSGTS